jgi:histone deacetylase complex regulatory component SIN3
MANLGDFLKAINITKENLLEEDSLTEKEYVPFVVNRTLSYFPDTVL